MMNRAHDGGDRVPTLQARLRREARATKPDFSAAFHARLMERIASEVEAPSPRREVSLRRPIGGRVLIVLLGIGAVAAAVAILVTSGTPARGPEGGSPVRVSVASGDESPTTVSIEAFPMYDDIDASVRTGVWMLASTIVEVPDWVRLADFDAPGTAAESASP